MLLIHMFSLLETLTSNLMQNVFKHQLWMGDDQESNNCLTPEETKIRSVCRFLEFQLF